MLWKLGLLNEWTSLLWYVLHVMNLELTCFWYLENKSMTEEHIWVYVINHFTSISFLVTYMFNDRHAVMFASEPVDLFILPGKTFQPAMASYSNNRMEALFQFHNKICSSICYFIFTGLAFDIFEVLVIRHIWSNLIQHLIYLKHVFFSISIT